jgi:hypothetical protein
MYFPFAHHFNDIQCHKVQGTEHGDAALQIDMGCVVLDGNADYITVSIAKIDLASQFIQF